MSTKHLELSKILHILRIEQKTKVMKPLAWACKKCNKIDWADSEEQLAKPEHVSHRGIDIGNCDGKMIPLYTIKSLFTLDKATKQITDQIDKIIADKKRTITILVRRLKNNKGYKGEDAYSEEHLKYSRIAIKKDLKTIRSTYRQFKSLRDWIEKNFE